MERRRHERRVIVLVAVCHRRRRGTRHSPAALLFSPAFLDATRGEYGIRDPLPVRHRRCAGRRGDVQDRYDFLRQQGWSRRGVPCRALAVSDRLFAGNADVHLGDAVERGVGVRDGGDAETRRAERGAKRRSRIRFFAPRPAQFAHPPLALLVPLYHIDDCRAVHRLRRRVRRYRGKPRVRRVAILRVATFRRSSSVLRRAKRSSVLRQAFPRVLGRRASDCRVGIPSVVPARRQPAGNVALHQRTARPADASLARAERLQRRRHAGRRAGCHRRDPFRNLVSIRVALDAHRAYELGYRYAGVLDADAGCRDVHRFALAPGVQSKTLAACHARVLHSRRARTNANINWQLANGAALFAPRPALFVICHLFIGHSVWKRAVAEQLLFQPGVCA